MAEAKSSGALTLRILTPQGELASVSCDSINLPLADDREGRGGGSIGIRPGHENCIMALQKGRAVARRGGETVFSAKIAGGFASVRDNVVQLLSPEAEKE